MKKILIFGLVVAILVVGGFVVLANFFGKTLEERVMANMSELTEEYFYGEGSNFSVTIASGMREQDYAMNGKAGEQVEFALVTLRLQEELKQRVVKVDIKIDEDVIAEQELELNPLDGTYMADIERRFGGDEVIEVTLGTESIAVQNLSKDFAVDAAKAVEIAAKELETQISQQKRGTSLDAECYLRVLDKKANGFDELFWCFTVVTPEGETHSVVLSTQDGKVLAKSEPATAEKE